MSVSNINKFGVDDTQQLPRDILADHHGFKVNENFVLKFQKGNKNVTKDIKDSCKVLHFSMELTFDKVLSKISKLDSKQYSQLFIFNICATNLMFSAKQQEEFYDKLKKIQKKLIKFADTRPIILQMISEDKNVIKIYYREQMSKHFTIIDHQQGESEYSDVFSSFLYTFFNGKFNNSEIDVLNAVREFENCSLVLRFLQTLNLSDEFFGSLLFDRAMKGSKAEFLATLDSPFDSSGRIISSRAQKNISDIFEDEDPGNDDSILLAAIKNNNKEVTDYLITYWTHLIQQLPFDHQVKISTAAFETSQLDVLCDLLDIADFPYPKDFKIEFINSASLSKITTERVEFKAEIEAENYIKIDQFIIENPRLKFIYNHENNSALTEAIKLKKFAMFYYLKSLDCRGENCQEVLQKLSKDEKEQAIKQATNQRKMNVLNAKTNINNSVLLLSTRSLIHNSRISKEEDVEYRKKIIKWFEDIHKVAPELIDVAASCIDMKIIFDFESDSVENVSLVSTNAAGSMYPFRKWIFIGAKLSDRDCSLIKQREQTIKGVLAHELCHFVMRLVYENQENPYYQYMTRDRDLFENIVKLIDKWSSEESEVTDDECNENISSVFKLYSSKDFHPELIVRVVQILVEFDNNVDHLRHLQQKYIRLFEFWYDFVVPELQRFINENREAVRKENKSFGLIKDFEDNKIKFNLSNDLKILNNNKSVIIITNISKLLIINICNQLQQKFGNQLDAQNIFVDSQKLRNVKLLSNLRSIIAENSKINIVVDCSKDINIDWNSVKFSEESNLIFIISNESQLQNVEKIMLDRKDKAAVTTIDYNWSHLKEESQTHLLETKIYFQNNSEFTLLDLFKKDVNLEESTTDNQCDIQDKSILKVCSDKVDDQLLNMLLNRSETLIINPLQEHEKHFKFLFQPRKFLKHCNNKINNKKMKTVSKILQKELISEVKNQQYVLISDQAGNGKSWAMKNIARILREENPTKWVTNVDLKQFIDEFKAQKGEPEFSTFMIENILNLNRKFETKIFQKMYKNGKVFILFDGFDEIAPNCAEFVSKLIQSFQLNGGNQLWIATRDYFEVDLMEKLYLDVAYSLDEMTKDEGVDLIAKSWVLIDSNDQSEPKTKEDFEKVVKTLPKYESYQQKAHQIIIKALLSRRNSVGLPQLFKMIADGFKDVKDVDDLQGTKIYIKFIEILYIRWSRKKGQIRKKANVKSQRFDLNFWKFHQYHAILSLFLKLAAILFPGYDGNEWPEEEVIACGILSKRNGKYYFLHETFREFFVADAIVNALKKPVIEEKVVEIFVYILTVEKFGVIQMFLNDIIDEIIASKIALVIVQSVNYEVAVNLFYNNTNREIFKISDLNKFLKLQEYFVNFLNLEDLINLIIENYTFCKIIKSCPEIEVFEDFVIKTETKTDRELVRNGLMLVSGKNKENIFYSLFTSSHLNAHTVQKFLKIMEKFLTVTEIFKLINKCNNKKQNILQICIEKENKNNLKILWTEIEKYFAVRNFSQNFKEVFMPHDKNIIRKNILHSAASCEKIDFHETLWELLLKAFENRQQLKDFILQKDNERRNFVHELVNRNENPAIIELTFKNLKETFSETQFQQILKSRGRWEKNLLQTAARFSKVLKVHQFLWKTFRDFCGNDEKFLKMLKEFDEFGRNILHMAANHSSSEVFEFVIQELEKIASRDEIRQMFVDFENTWNRNLLQTVAEWNWSFEIHEALWKAFRKYFVKTDILKFIKHIDKDGNNVLCNALRFSTKEIVELTWNEIKGFLNYDEQVEYLKLNDKRAKNLHNTIENFNYKNDIQDWVINLMQEYKI